MLSDTVRVIAFVVGALFCLGGLAEIAAVLQRHRYVSETAEKTGQDPGPGGGESGWIEPRFRPTSELFRDPVSGHLMRVWEDPYSGQRRYRADS